jgi:hypothetical protein
MAPRFENSAAPARHGGLQPKAAADGSGKDRDRCGAPHWRDTPGTVKGVNPAGFRLACDVHLLRAWAAIAVGPESRKPVPEGDEP